MDSGQIHCPLCCGKNFVSREALADHLTNYLSSISCSVCNGEFSSIPDLCEHLRNQACKGQETVISHTNNEQQNTSHFGLESIQISDIYTKKELIELENGNSNVDQPKDQNLSENQRISKDQSISEDQVISENETMSELQPQTLYVTLMGNEKNKTNLGSEDSLDVGDNGQYVIVNQQATNLLSGGAVVTKQNSDGTISITDVANISEKGLKKFKMEQDGDDSEVDGQDDMYSCNTCGVSFSSVLEHIQNYHNDQDVVVEVNESNIVEENENLPLEYVSYKNGVLDTADVRVSKRVITETGDIVETINTSKKSSLTNESLSVEEEVFDSKGQVFTRRYVQIDKPQPKEPDHKLKSSHKLPYHQVVEKEIKTIDGGETIKVFHCTACHVYVTKIAEFESHPCKTRKYNCPHCPVSYENTKSLSAHMKIHKSTKQLELRAATANAPSVIIPDVLEGPFKCDICNTELKTNKSLKLHKRMHDPIKVRPFENVVHQSADGVDTIVPEKFFSCCECNKSIPLACKSIHSSFHRNTEKFNCDICNKKFSSNDYLVMHMNVHSTEKVEVKKSEKELPYSCLYCTRQFSRPHEKVKHERIHTGEKPHSCVICGKSFRVAYCLTLHMRTHTGIRPYECNHCGKRFKAHSVYNHHLLTHSDVRAYKCPFCPKAFKTSVQLAGHKNSHTKPFSCTYCNRPFASLYAVRVHTETHRRQNNLRYSCDLCGATYARTFALKDHMKQAHQKDVETSDIANGHLVPTTVQLNSEDQASPSEDWYDTNTKTESKITLLPGSNNIDLQAASVNEMELTIGQ